MSRRFATKEAHEKSHKKVLTKKASVDCDNEEDCLSFPKKRRLVRKSEKLSALSGESSQDSVVSSPQQSLALDLVRDSTGTRSEDKESMLGYDPDDGFVVDDDAAVEFYDPENPDKVVSDKLSRKQRRVVEAEVARDAYNYDENMMKLREKFSSNAALAHLRSTTVDTETAIDNLFFDEGRVDDFIEKFDAVLLGGTLCAFKSKTSCKTIEACLSHGLWKLSDLPAACKDLCVLCGHEREACKQQLITRERYVVGSVGDDCATRWFLLAQVYDLRHEILSLYGCRGETHNAKEYEQKISYTKDLCIRTLQELQNRYIVNAEEKNND